MSSMIEMEVKMKELKISKEAVLEASKKCPDAKEVLKALFPDVFKKTEKDVTRDLTLKIVHSTRGTGRYFFELNIGDDNVLLGKPECKIEDGDLIIPFWVNDKYEVKVVGGNFKILKSGKSNE